MSLSTEEVAVEEMLRDSGWSVINIEPGQGYKISQSTKFASKLTNILGEAKQVDIDSKGCPDIFAYKEVSDGVSSEISSMQFIEVKSVRDGLNKQQIAWHDRFSELSPEIWVMDDGERIAKLELQDVMIDHNGKAKYRVVED